MALLAGLMLVTKHPGLTDAGHDCWSSPRKGPVVLQMQLPVHNTGIEAYIDPRYQSRRNYTLYVSWFRDMSESRNKCMQPVSCTSNAG